MKKLFVLAALLLGISVCANAQFDSAKDAAKAAQEACDVFGQKATSGTADNHTGVMRYGSSSTTENEHLGTRNHYELNGTVSAKTEGIVSEAGATAGGGFSRDGEQDNTRKTTTKDDSGYLYYKCEDE